MLLDDRRRLLLNMINKFFVFKEGEGFINGCDCLMERRRSALALDWNTSFIKLAGNDAEDLTTPEEEHSPVGGYNMIIDSVDIEEDGSYSGIYTGVGFNFGRYKKLCIEYRSIDSESRYGSVPYGYAGYTLSNECYVGKLNDFTYNDEYMLYGKTALPSTGRTIIKIDISNIKDYRLIGLYGPVGQHITYVYNVWFE